MNEPKRTPLEQAGENAVRRDGKRLPRSMTPRSTVVSAFVLAACAALAAGCATASTRTSVTTAAHPSPSNHTKSATRTPKQRAEADAAAILASFAVPPGAGKLPGAPSAEDGVLKRPFQQPDDPDLVDDVSWWQVPGQPRQLLAWERKHLSHRFSPGASGSGQDGDVTYWGDEFTLPAITGVLDSRTLIVEAVAAGGGQTDLRVDAQVTWIPSRPATEVVPSAARAVTLTVKPNMNSTAKPPAPVTITKLGRVRALAALINGLPEFPPGMYSCPADFGDALVLTFRAHPGGPALAVATVELSGCEGVGFTVGGKRQPGLGGPGDGSAVATQALKIAGLTWTLPGFSAQGAMETPLH
jgi:hypothetical protein